MLQTIAREFPTCQASSTALASNVRWGKLGTAYNAKLQIIQACSPVYVVLPVSNIKTCRDISGSCKAWPIHAHSREELS
jgi:hypothetical protein